MLKTITTGVCCTTTATPPIGGEVEFPPMISGPPPEDDAIGDVGKDDEFATSVELSKNKPSELETASALTDVAFSPTLLTGKIPEIVPAGDEVVNSCDAGALSSVLVVCEVASPSAGTLC